MVVARRPHAVSAAALGAGCALLLACGGGDDDAGDPHASIALWPIPNTGRPLQGGSGAGRGGSVAPPPTGGRDWPPFDPIDPGMQPEEDAGPPMEPDPTLALLDPDEVYIFGTLSEGLCYRKSIAPVFAPDEALVGFGCYADGADACIRPSDGRLVYYDKSSHGVFAFHCDGCVYASQNGAYPSDTWANDEEISAAVAAVCAIAGTFPDAYVWGFRVTAEGRTLVQCGDGLWYDEDGAEVPALMGTVPLSVGHQGTALLAGGVLDLATGALAPLTGLQDFTPLATRVREDGYWIAVQPMDAGLPPELWSIAFDGSATLQGTYPAPPPDHVPRQESALDGDGRLVQLSYSPVTSRDTIIRRSIDGESEAVYDEADNPTVKLHSSSLFTGP